MFISFFLFWGWGHNNEIEWSSEQFGKWGKTSRKLRMSFLNSRFPMCPPVVYPHWSGRGQAVVRVRMGAVNFEILRKVGNGFHPSKHGNSADFDGTIAVFYKLEGGCSFWRPFSIWRSSGKFSKAKRFWVGLKFSLLPKNARILGNFNFLWIFIFLVFAHLVHGFWGNFVAFQHFCAVGYGDARKK